MHDSAPWCQSRLAKQLESGALDMLLFYLTGDGAFAVSDSLLAPWPEQELAAEKGAFNFYLSQLRQTIERAFWNPTRELGSAMAPHPTLPTHLRAVGGRPYEATQLYI